MKKIVFLFSFVLVITFIVTLFGVPNVTYADNGKYKKDDIYVDKETNKNKCSGWNWFRKNKECNPEADKPPVVYIFATKYSIKYGKSTELYLKTKNKIDSCTASGGWTGIKSKDVKETVSPLVTTTYTITCTNEYGSYSDSVEILVKGKATTTPPTEPPATTTPTVSLSFSGSPLNITDDQNSTLTWNSTSSTYCIASNAWSGMKSFSGNEVVSPNATSTYTLACGNSVGTSTQSVTVNVTPTSTPPVQTLDHVVISEVYYDVDSSRGSESINEWVEIHNSTGAAVDISGWVVADTSLEFDLVPVGTIIPNNGFVVLTASTTTSGFWGSVPMISLGNRLGNSLGNSGDTIYLKNAASSTVDSMSYGSAVPAAFTPTVPLAPSLNSLKRSNLLIDTNSATDWENNATSTPGAI